MPVDHAFHKCCTKEGLADIMDAYEGLVGEDDFDIDIRGSQNRTPLMRACGNPDAQVLDIVKYLVDEQKANPLLTDASGRTCLHFAAMAGNHQLIEYLVAKGVQVNTLSNSGFSPLHAAVSAGCVRSIEKLLQFKADKSVIYEDETPLQLAQKSANAKDLVAALDGGSASANNKRSPGESSATGKEAASGGSGCCSII